jgi:hypothetical protein
LRADWYVAVFGHATADHDVGGPMLGDAEEEVEGHLAAVIENGNAPAAVERRDAPTRDEGDSTLCERGEQRLRRVGRGRDWRGERGQQRTQSRPETKRRRSETGPLVG